jgi:phytanoyl-CoA hydroxylase
MEQYDDLMRDGYAVVPGALARAACEQALDAVAGFKRRNAAVVAPNENEHGHMYRVSNLHLAVPALAQAFAALNAPFAVCDRFFGAPASLYTSLYFERGSEQKLHRDTPYFTTRPGGRYLGVWLALDDVDAGNGPLLVVPGSHLLPPIDVEAMARDMFARTDGGPAAAAQGWAPYQEAVKRQCDEYGLVPRELHVSRGDVVIWHPELFHGGAIHLQRERSRNSLVMHVTPVGTQVYPIEVFFDPGRELPEAASWNYYDCGDRKIVHLGHVDFWHKFLVAVEDFA